MNTPYVSDDIKYIGASDHGIDLFEGQYKVPNGMAYNSYVIIDEKIAVMDTVDKSVADMFLASLDAALGGRTPDYLVVQHLEPDHSAAAEALIAKYPDMQLVMTKRAAAMAPQFIDADVSGRTVAVGEGDTLELGRHTLTFYPAPMVHWPEVMVTYDSADKVLFSADCLGKFGALDADEDWTCEARRYYFNIAGKYGAQVQTLLKKTAALDIRTVCPLHGPILSEKLDSYFEKYGIWSSYGVESEGVFIAYASFHGNTAAAAERMAEQLKNAGEANVVVADLARADLSECVDDAFRYGKVILAAPTYDGGIAPRMEDFLNRLKAKNFQNRRVGIIENGSWAPVAAKQMKDALGAMKNITLCDTVVTVKTRLTDANTAAIAALASEILA
jgi:flavorubredoxin